MGDEGLCPFGHDETSTFGRVHLTNREEVALLGAVRFRADFSPPAI
jgi:hypothetical protein